jgi:threonine synthase
MLRVLRETGGGAVAIPDADMSEMAALGTREEGIDFSPEGGASIAAAVELQRQGVLKATDRVVLFNTGAGWLYRDGEQLLAAL